MAQTSAVSSPPGSGSHMSSPPGSRPLVSIAPAPQSKPSSVLIQVNQNLSGSQLEDSGAVIQEHEVSDTDKTAIYKHPLFPLLALLFEKCEQASQSAECPSSESFDVDIQSFVHHQEREKRPFLCDDPDLDCLMLKAIQVLRIHLLELEKVTDLCKDFCTRYISCLKGKLQSEKLLHVEGYDGDDMDFSESHEKELDSNANNTPVGAPATPLSLQPGQIVSGGTVYQMVNTPQGLVAQPIQIQSQQVTGSVSVGHVVHGSTPLSQIGIPPTPTSTTHSTATTPSPLTPSTPSASSFFEDEDYEGKNSKTKRGILPKQATNVMRSWLFQHIVHPYPTEDEKRQIAAQTNLTLLQVNNWFINARRRILQPMLDASNPDQIRAKKKTQNRQVQRFWPESIASIQPQTTAAGVAPQPPAGQVVSSASDPSRLIVPVPHGTLISTDGRHILTNTQPVSTTATNQVTMVTESPLLSQAQAVSSSPPITNIEGAGSTHSNDGQPLIKVTDQDFKLTSKEEVQDTHDATDTGAVAD